MAALKNPARSVKFAPQMAQEIGSSNQTDEINGVTDQKPQAAIQDVINRIDRLIRGNCLQAAGHSLAYRRVKFACVPVNSEQQVRFIEHAYTVSSLHHGNLRNVGHTHSLKCCQQSV